MSAYPAQIDNSDTLFVGADKIGTATLETTLTAACLSTDTTISVADAIGPGFAAAAMHLRIGDEIVRYTGRTATSFTGLTRGANGPAAAHAAGTPVRAVFSWLQILAIQQAIIAIETVLGTSGAYAFAAAAHAHSGADITSGTVPAPRLPTATGASAGAAGTAGILAAPPAGTVTDVLRRDLTWGAAGGGTPSASGVSFTPAGGISSSNVQNAIQELDSEKAAASHGHAADAITFTPYSSGGIASNDVQGAIMELADERVRESRQVLTPSGSGLSGGGNLAADISLYNEGVHGFKGAQTFAVTRNGLVNAEAGDYRDYMIDSSPGGWPSWLAGSTTVRDILSAIITRIGSVESDLSLNYYTKGQVDSGLATKSTSSHYHNQEGGGITSGPIG